MSCWEDATGIFWTPYVRSIYVLCPWGIRYSLNLTPTIQFILNQLEENALLSFHRIDIDKKHSWSWIMNYLCSDCLWFKELRSSKIKQFTRQYCQNIVYYIYNCHPEIWDFTKQEYFHEKWKTIKESTSSESS